MRREREGMELEPAPSAAIEKNGFHGEAPADSPGVPRRRPRFLWSRMLTLPLTAALLCGLCAFLVTSYAMPKWYQSGVTLYFPAMGGGGGSILQQLQGGGGSDPGMSLGYGLYTTPLVGSTPNMAMSVLSTGRCQGMVMENLHLAQRWHLKPEDAYHRFVSNTSYGVDRNGYLAISAMDRDPRLAQQMVNAYVAAMQKVSTELSVYYARRNRLALQSRLHHLKALLVNEQAELLTLQTRASRNQPLGKQADEAYAALETQRRQTQIDLDANEADIRKRQQLADATSDDALNLPVQLPFAQKANENLRDLERQFAAVKAVYGPDYPQYQELQAQVAQAQAQVQSEVQREVRAVRKGISPQMSELYATHAKLRAQLSGIREASAPVRAALIAQPTVEMRQAQLTSDVLTNQELVKGMSLEVERAQEAEDRNVPFFQPVDGAGVPDKPSLPRIGFTTAFASIAGFLLGLAWLVGRSTMQQAFVQDRLAWIADEYGMLEPPANTLSRLHSPNYPRGAEPGRTLVEVAAPDTKRAPDPNNPAPPPSHE